MSDEPDNPKLPGRWYGSLSPRPIKELMSFILGCDDYTKELRHKYNSAVFKAHPGIKSTLITDMRGLDFVFNAAPEVLDRLDDKEPGFGGLSFNRQEMLGGVTPALLAHSGNHKPARAIVMAAMRIRQPFFAPACQKVLDYGIPMLRGPSRGVAVNFQHAMHHAAVDICFEWLFDIKDAPASPRAQGWLQGLVTPKPAPPGSEAQSWIKGCFGLRSDQAFANVILRGISRHENGPTAAQRRYGAAAMDAIRKCGPYGQFRDAALIAQVPERELPAHLMFAASFNATGGAWATLHPALAQLSVDTVTRARLAEEIATFSGKFADLNGLPFLHDFFLESMRLFGRPRHYYRRVMQDGVVLPVSIGDPVPVKKGTTLCLVATVARQDRTVWGDDASVFDPERYAREPGLRARVCPFGPPPSPTGKNQYGCAGATNGVALGLWKTLAVALARRTDWKLTPWPEPDVDAFDGVRPSEFMWSRE